MQDRSRQDRKRLQHAYVPKTPASGEQRELTHNKKPDFSQQTVSFLVLVLTSVCVCGLCAWRFLAWRFGARLCKSCLVGNTLTLVMHQSEVRI